MRITIILAAVAALVVVLPAGAARPAHAGPPQPSGTIAIAAGYTPALGDDLLFDYTVSNVPNWANPRIQIECYQDVNNSGIISRTEDFDANGFPDDLVYAEARNAESELVYGQPFTPLGGGSSLWLDRGGPAECDAELYYWRFHPVQTYNLLASVSFAAGG